MNNKVNNTSERLHLNNTILSEAQCGEQCGDPLEELMIAWQQHSDRIDQIAGQHDLSHIRLAPRLFVLSSRRRRVLSSLAMALVCLAAIAGMVMLRRHLISDILEQLFLVFLALLVVVALFHSLLQLFPPHRQPQLNFQFSILNSQLSPVPQSSLQSWQCFSSLPFLCRMAVPCPMDPPHTVAQPSPVCHLFYPAYNETETIPIAGHHLSRHCLGGIGREAVAPHCSLRAV